MTDADRRRWRVWSWVFLVLGPAMVLLSFPMTRTLNGLLPPGWRSWLSFGMPLFIFLFPVLGAMGSAFCLGKSRPARRTASDFLAFVIVTGLVMLFGQWVIVALWWAMVPWTRR